MELIETFEQAEKNCARFNELIQDMERPEFRTFGKFSRWYYFPKIRQFAPNKYIGFIRGADDKYSKKGHGADTKMRLDDWFDEVPQDSKRYKKLAKMLNQYASDVGKGISKKLASGGGIYIPRGTVVDSSDSEQEYSEGAQSQALITTYERNKKARKVCLNYHGYACKACDMDFEEVYGRLGREFIHVHHLREVSSAGKEYKLNPKKDLIPLCPNCHAMVHRKSPPMPVEKLKRVLRRMQF